MVDAAADTTADTAADKTVPDTVGGTLDDKKHGDKYNSNKTRTLERTKRTRIICILTINIA